MPTGTLANLLATRAMGAGRGRVAVQETSHLYNDCGDAAASLAGMTLVPLAPGRAWFTVEELRSAAARSGEGKVARPLAAVSVEWPVRRCLGQAAPLEELSAISRFCRARSIGLHLDGARLFVAAAARGVPVRRVAALFDTVYVSLYKCFGTPAGAVLAGPRRLIEGLAAERRRFGGCLAESTLLAGLALERVDGLERRLAAALARGERLFAELKRRGADVELPAHGTNVAILRAGPELRARLMRQGVALRSRDAARRGYVLSVNETILRRPPAELAAAFLRALSL